MVDPYRYPSFRIDRVLLEEHSFRVIAFGGPFHDLREYRGPEGATFEFIRDYADRIEQIADSIAPEKQSIMTRSWEGGGSLNLILSDIKERERSQMEIAETLSKEVRKETLAAPSYNSNPPSADAGRYAYPIRIAGPDLG